MMKNVYEDCPVLASEGYQLRLIATEDAQDLLGVYGDKKAVLYFNSDNCNGNDFYCSTVEQVKEMIKYWLWEYDRKGFVRWSVIDKKEDKVIGTVELFHREAKDAFNHCGLLRLDVSSDYESVIKLQEIFELIDGSAYSLFECDLLATKAAMFATERIQALEHVGYTLSNEKLIGHDGTEYDNYWVRKK